MAMIKCPGCGQTVLSIASTCPGCGHLLMTNPTARQNGDPYQACQHCGKLVTPHAKVCLYCGHRARKRPVSRQVAVSLAGTVVIAVAAFVMVSMGGSEATTAQRPPQADGERVAFPAPPVVASSVSTEPAATSSAPVTANGDSVVEASRPEPTPGPELETRWTETWANVREGRGVRSAVARVLEPGVRVEVTDRRGGWWVVYVDGAPIGHVSNAVLTRTPPAGGNGRRR